MSVSNIKLIGIDHAEMESFRPDADKVVSGDPLQHLWHCYDSQDGAFGAGIWEGQPGSHKVNYTEEEVCFMLEGRVAVADENGEEITLERGDMFVIPSGFKGTWTTLERAKKLYVVYEKT